MTFPCGCCTTASASRTRHRVNRPWLSAIDYRLGTFATFREAILDELAGTAELARLRSRVSDDYTVAAIEQWAAVADVLTFYTERMANEAFIRTATLRDSVLRLVRVIDYQLAPGAAATTALAFTLERDAVAVIPVGARVQSVPAEGETPQKYETVESLAASAHLNRLRLLPGPVAATPLAAGASTAIAAPDSAAIAGLSALTPGGHVALFTQSALEILAVADVRAVDELLVVRWRQPVRGTGFGAAIDGTAPGTQAARLGRSFHVFGHDAPPIVVVSGRTTASDATTTYLAQATTDYTLAGTTLQLDGKYPDLKPGSRVLVVFSAGDVVRTAPFDILAVGDQPATREARYTRAGTEISVVAISGTATTVTLQTITQPLSWVVGSGDIRSVVVHELVGDPLRFWPYVYPDRVATGTVHVAGRRAGWSAIEIERSVEKGAYTPGAVLDIAELPIGRRVIALDDAGGTPVATTVAGRALVGLDLAIGPTASDAATLAELALAPGQAAPMTVLVSARLNPPLTLPPGGPELTVRIGGAPTQTIALDAGAIVGGSLSAVAGALQVAIRSALPGAPAFAKAMVWSTATELVVAAGVPGEAITFGPSQDDAATVATLGLEPQRARYLDGVLSGPASALAGTSVNGTVRVQRGIDPPTEPLVNLSITTPSAFATALGSVLGVTTRLREDTRILLMPAIPAVEPRSWLRLTLVLDEPLALDTASAALLANVASASHGETVQDEVVGDGDAAAAFQRFTLRKKPVTYVPAAVPGGIASSLQVFVNGAMWTEVPTLYGAGPTDEVYTTRLADDGTRSVQLGDGSAGARAATGRGNVTATYRQGIGVAGRVRARTLRTMLDRVTGAKGVTNPIAADGGADPETLARARETAPGTVRTFGRAISLRDFEDATLLAGEVAKAAAAWIWTGRRRIVHVTVAGQGGATFSASKLAALAATLAAARDPNHPLLIGNYARVAVLVAATIIVDDRAVAETVRAAARTELLDALSFERRAFAEAVDLSDVYGVLQRVPGVKAVDIDQLDLKSTDTAFRNAHGIDPAKGALQPRLLMLSARPSGSPGVVLPAELAWVEVPALDVVLRSTGGITL